MERKQKILNLHIWVIQDYSLSAVSKYLGNTCKTILFTNYENYQNVTNFAKLKLPIFAVSS